MPSWLIAILNSGAVWTAVLALVNVLIKLFWPAISVELLAAINALVVAILAAAGITVTKVLVKSQPHW